MSEKEFKNRLPPIHLNVQDDAKQASHNVCAASETPPEYSLPCLDSKVVREEVKMLYNGLNEMESRRMDTYKSYNSKEFLLKFLYAKIAQGYPRKLVHDIMKEEKYLLVNPQVNNKSTTSILDDRFNDYANIKVSHQDNEFNVSAQYHIHGHYEVLKRGAYDNKYNQLTYGETIENFDKHILKKEGLSNIGEGLSITGKMDAEEIYYFVKYLVSRFPNEKWTKKLVEEKMRKLAVGTDCSKYVSDLLGKLIDQNINEGSLYFNHMNKDFIQISEIKNVKPGDVMHTNGHVRIVHEVLSDHVDHKLTNSEDYTFMYISESTWMVDRENSSGVTKRLWAIHNKPNSSKNKNLYLDQKKNEWVNDDESKIYSFNRHTSLQNK